MYGIIAMDKHDQRISRARSLKRQLYFKQAFFLFVALFQCIISLWSLSRGNFYAFILFAILDLGYLLDRHSKELFIDQLREALDDMESKIHVGRAVIYKMPISSDVGSSYIWESIRARVLYRYRYHSRQFDYNFLPADSSDPAFCAWSAAWFYANDDLEHTPCTDFLNFVILLAKYGFRYDYFSDVSYAEWRASLRFHYADPELKSIVNSFLQEESNL